MIEQLVAPDANRSTTALEISKFPDFGTAVQSLLDSGRIVLRDDAESRPRLTAMFVHEKLLLLASVKGRGAVALKQQHVVELLQQCRYESSVYIVLGRGAL